MYSKKKCKEYFENLKDYFEILGVKGMLLVMVGNLVYGMLLDHCLKIDIWYESIWQVIVPMIIPFILGIIGSFVVPAIEAICLSWIVERNRQYHQEKRKRS